MMFSLSLEWQEFLTTEINSRYYVNLHNRVLREYEAHPDKVFPPIHRVYEAFSGIQPSEVRVVILGQDPYPTRGHAHGLAFSVERDVSPLPRSLSNIFRELTSDMSMDCPQNGNLGAWRTQGVLLLNSVLTVKEGQPGSHKGLGWEQFTDAVITRLSKQVDHLVFMLWGAHAQRKIPLIDGAKHLILCAPHPSPLAAHRGFLGCRHFSKANDFLAAMQRPIIAW